MINCEKIVDELISSGYACDIDKERAYILLNRDDIKTLTNIASSRMRFMLLIANLILLDKKNILTVELVQLMIAAGDEQVWFFNQILSCIDYYKSDLVDQDMVMLLVDNIDNIFKIYSGLTLFGNANDVLFSFENISTLVYASKEKDGVENVARGMILLYDKNPELLKNVSNHRALVVAGIEYREMVESLSVLDKSGILTPVNRKALLVGRVGYNTPLRAKGLVILHKANLLTAVNRRLVVTAHGSPIAMANKLLVIYRINPELIIYPGNYKELVFACNEGWNDDLMKRRRRDIDTANVQHKPLIIAFSNKMPIIQESSSYHENIGDNINAGNDISSSQGSESHPNYFCAII